MSVSPSEKLPVLKPWVVLRLTCGDTAVGDVGGSGSHGVRLCAAGLLVDREKIRRGQSELGPQQHRQFLEVKGAYVAVEQRSWTLPMIDLTWRGAVVSFSWLDLKTIKPSLASEKERTGVLYAQQRQQLQAHCVGNDVLTSRLVGRETRVETRRTALAD